MQPTTQKVEASNNNETSYHYRPLSGHTTGHWKDPQLIQVKQISIKERKQDLPKIQQLTAYLQEAMDQQHHQEEEEFGQQQTKADVAINQQQFAIPLHKRQTMSIANKQSESGISLFAKQKSHKKSLSRIETSTLALQQQKNSLHYPKWDASSVSILPLSKIQKGDGEWELPKISQILSGIDTSPNIQSRDQALNTKFQINKHRKLSTLRKRQLSPLLPYINNSSTSNISMQSPSQATFATSSAIDRQASNISCSNNINYNHFLKNSPSKTRMMVQQFLSKRQSPKNSLNGNFSEESTLQNSSIFLNPVRPNKTENKDDMVFTVGHQSMTSQLKQVDEQHNIAATLAQVQQMIREEFMNDEIKLQEMHKNLLKKINKVERQKRSSSQIRILSNKQHNEHATENQEQNSMAYIGERNQSTLQLIPEVLSYDEQTNKYRADQKAKVILDTFNNLQNQVNTLIQRFDDDTQPFDKMQNTSKVQQPTTSLFKMNLKRPFVRKTLSIAVNDYNSNEKKHTKPNRATHSLTRHTNTDYCSPPPGQSTPFIVQPTTSTYKQRCKRAVPAVEQSLQTANASNKSDQAITTHNQKQQLKRQNNIAKAAVNKSPHLEVQSYRDTFYNLMSEISILDKHHYEDELSTVKTKSSDIEDIQESSCLEDNTFFTSLIQLPALKKRKVNKEEVTRVIQELIDKQLQEINADHHDNDNLSQSSSEGKNHSQQKKIFTKYAEEIRRNLKEGDLFKNAFAPKLFELLQDDIRFKYLMSCQREQTLMLPLLHKLKKRTLNLAGYSLNGANVRALTQAFNYGDHIINRVILENNSIHDEDFAELLCGLQHLQEIKSIVYIRNELMIKSAEVLGRILGQKSIPHHLDELRLVNCIKMGPLVTSSILDGLIERSFIKRLSLVNANISDEICLRKLIHFISHSKYLSELDLSWNNLRSQQLLGLMECIAENRQIQFLNLSWNTLIDQSKQSPQFKESDDPETYLEQYDKQISTFQARKQKSKDSKVQVSFADQPIWMLYLLTRFIKRNTNLQHLDLSHTGLNVMGISVVAKSLRRARSLIALHLTGNPGVTPAIKIWIQEKLKCINVGQHGENKDQQNYDKIDKFNEEIQEVFDSKLSTKEIIEKGFQLTALKKQRKQLDQHILNSDIIDLSGKDNTKKLILIRWLGHKHELPLSTKWRMLNEKQDKCWVCNRQIYTILLWSKFIAQKTEVKLSQQEKNGIINRVIQDFNNENQFLSNVIEETKQPHTMIAGSFTNWQFVPFESVHLLTKNLDVNREEPEFLKQLGDLKEASQAPVIKVAGAIMRARLSKFKVALLKQVMAKQELERKQDWREILDKTIKYKRPCLIDEEFAPTDEETGRLIRIEREARNLQNDYNDEYFDEPESSDSDSSSNEEDDDANDNESPMAPDIKAKYEAAKAREKAEREEAERKREEKELEKQKPIEELENLYALPIFMPYGRQFYIVRSPEKNGKTQYYVHQALIPIRTEDIPLAVKPSKKKEIVQRRFKKDQSVFRDWKEDTPPIIDRSAKCDQMQWKAARFIKDYDEVLRCWDVIVSHYVKLKDLFITLACNSQFPHITWIDFSEFAEKCNLIDKNLTLATIDRLFIATNYEIEENDENPDRALCRYELYELFLRIAVAKYYDTKQAKTQHEALERLLMHDILPKYPISPWQVFRDRQLWTLECNDIYEANHTGLFQVYSRHFDPRKRWMTQAEALELLIKNLNMTEKEAIWCYGMSKMTVVDEAEESTIKYKRMVYAEFLELIARVAEVRFRGTDMDESLVLPQKIEFVIDDILGIVGLQRQNVISQQEDDVSMSSDDEY